MPSPVSKFPAPPDYPPRRVRRLNHNEQCADTGQRSYSHAKYVEPRTATLPPRIYGQSGGTGPHAPRIMG